MYVMIVFFDLRYEYKYYRFLRDGIYIYGIYIYYTVTICTYGFL